MDTDRAREGEARARPLGIMEEKEESERASDPPWGGEAQGAHCGPGGLSSSRDPKRRQLFTWWL